MDKIRVFFAAPLPRTARQEAIYFTDRLISNVSMLLRALCIGDNVELISPRRDISEFDTATASDDMYVAQGQRERATLSAADVIVFSFDRDIDQGILGLTTNIEFGLYHTQPFAVFGCCSTCAPEHTQKIKYIKNLLQSKNKKFHEGIDALTTATVESIVRAVGVLERTTKDHAWLSQDPRRSMIPAPCFCVDSTAPWIARFISQIASFDVAAWYTLPDQSVFGYTAKVTTSDGKVEFVHFRPNMACVSVTHRSNNVYVRELRFPAGVEATYNAGGSSTSTAWDDPETIQKEVQEELGLLLPVDRFVPAGPPSFLSPLTDAAMVFHWHVELTQEEFTLLHDGQVNGNEGEMERCKLLIERKKKN